MIAFSPDFYIIFVLLQNLVVGWTKLGNLSNLPLQLTNMRPQTGNREKKKMKGTEKTKVHMHDRMILVVYTNQNS